MSSIARSLDSCCATTHELSVVAPYRLDLTVSALRRTATNPVDVYTVDGHYLRALVASANPLL